MNDNITELQTHGLFFSFSTDPFIDEVRQLTYRVIEVCHKNNIKTSVLTKCVKFMNDFDDAQVIPNMINYGVTITGFDSIEPGASLTSDRMMSLQIMKRLGCSTFISFEPIISFNKTYEYIKQSVDIGVDEIKLGLERSSTYDKQEAIKFIDNVREVTNDTNTKVMIKQSLQDMIDG